MSRKRSRYQEALVERAADEENESSEDDADDNETDEAEDDAAAAAEPDDTPAQKQKRLQFALNKDKTVVCHVCGKSGHKAGFVGSVYLDCPNKPCYLCKQPGHTTATCPHNLAVGGSSDGAAAGSNGGGGSSAAGGPSLVHKLLQREHSGRQARGPLAALRSPTWQVESAILKLHSRRVCCLAVPSSSDCHVISGDKKGGIAVWNFVQVHDRVLYSSIHRALVNSLRPSPWLTGGYDCVSASSDGTVKLFDVETGCSHTLSNINPGGWVQGCKWNMFYGMDTCEGLHVVYAGDSEGRVHVLDPRSQEPVNILQLHKPGSKVTSVSVNPASGAHVVLTAGNDHTAKLFDVRKLSSINTAAAAADSSTPQAPPTPTPAATAAEGATAGSSGKGSSRGGRGRGRGRATAAPPAAAAAAGDDAAVAAAGSSGRGKGRGRGRGSSRAGSSGGGSQPAAAAAAGGRGKNSAAALAAAAASTAELAVLKHGRVVNAAVFSPSGRKILTTCQDNRLRVWDNLLSVCGAAGGGAPPSREIVHSHDFNRYLTPFKAEWFPNDPSESLILCGRYISEDFGGVALHPVDIMDASTGRLLAALVDAHLETITPVNIHHPRLDVILSGSSRSLYKWVPQSDSEDDESEAEAQQDNSSRRGSAAAAAMAAMAAAAGATRRAGVSSSFVCFDADPQGGGTKKGGNRKIAGSKTKTKATSTAAAGSKSVRKRARRVKAAGSDDDDDGDDAGANSDDDDC